jgi:hypothetical protein
VARLRRELDSLQISQPRQQENASIGPRETSGQKQDATEGKISLSSHIDPPPRHKTQTNKPWYKTTSGWKTLLELVALPFAIGYAVVTFLSWRDVRDQFTLDQRPYVWLTPTGQAEIKYLPDGRIAWTYHYTNYGKTPANNVRVWPYMKIGNRDFEKLDSEAWPIFGGVIPPNKVDFGTAFSKTRVTPEEAKVLASTDGAMQIRVVITYTNMMGDKPGESSFCNMTVGVENFASGAAAYCGGAEYNYMK